MNLEVLKRPLTREQIDFKVAQITKTDNTIWVSILAYKDARVDMEVLDEAVGNTNWQVKYERDSKGVLQCAIGIWDETKALGSGDWVWKTSNGVESDYESEKGEYSDAFKRAGFMWGIGRKLYDFPQIWIMPSDNDCYEKDGKLRLRSSFRPNEWIWEISEDYQDITAYRKYGNEKKIVFQTKPYKK